MGEYDHYERLEAMESADDELQAARARIAELEQQVRSVTMYQARAEYIAQLEATLARVRKLPASWRAFTGMDRADCANDLEDTLAGK